MPEVTVKSMFPKVLWLPLKNGTYVSIRARGSRSVDKAMLQPKTLEKYRKRGFIAVIETKQEKEQKKRTRRATRKETAKDTSKDLQEDAPIEAATAEMPEAPRQDKERQKEDRGDAKKKSPSRGRRVSTTEETGVTTNNGTKKDAKKKDSRVKK